MEPEYPFSRYRQDNHRNVMERAMPVLCRTFNVRFVSASERTKKLTNISHDIIHMESEFTGHGTIYVSVLESFLQNPESRFVGFNPEHYEAMLYRMGVHPDYNGILRRHPDFSIRIVVAYVGKLIAERHVPGLEYLNLTTGQHWVPTPNNADVFEPQNNFGRLPMRTEYADRTMENSAMLYNRTGKTPGTTHTPHASPNYDDLYSSVGYQSQYTKPDQYAERPRHTGHLRPPTWATLTDPAGRKKFDTMSQRKNPGGGGSVEKTHGGIGDTGYDLAEYSAFNGLGAYNYGHPEVPKNRAADFYAGDEA